ncbi:hypothetical protein H4I96_02664 [Botrytis cinerea]
MAYHSQAGPSNPNLHAQQQYQQGPASYGNPSGGNGNRGQEQEAVPSLLSRPSPTRFLCSGRGSIHKHSAALSKAALPGPSSLGRMVFEESFRSPTRGRSPPSPGYPQSVSLIPYIRRLIVTGHDDPRIMGTWFGSNWVQGIGTIHELERRNYLFASKSKEWLDVKKYYDDSLAAEQSTPYMIPLPKIEEAELSSADEAWSGWMAMQDWVIGPRTPQSLMPPSRSRTPHYNSPRIKKESDFAN